MRRFVLSLTSILVLTALPARRAAAAVDLIRGSQFLDYVQYEVARRVSGTFKQSSNLALTSIGHVQFREAIACSADSKEPTSRFDVRREISMVQGERKILEELLLTRCHNRYTVLRMIRLGKEITSTEDSVLLRGQFPSFAGARMFDLLVADGNIKFHFEQRESSALTIASILPMSTSTVVYELNFVEAPRDDGSMAQNVRVRVLDGDNVVDSFTLTYSYLATTAGKAVPRQYLYMNGKEVSPRDYLQMTQEVYGNGVFSLVGMSLLEIFPLF